MVLQRLFTIVAGLAGPLNDGQKMAVLRIVQHHSQLPCQPELVALIIDLVNAFKRRVVLRGNVLIRHALVLPEG